MYLRQKNRAFTLVELLTVLAIITMLLGLLVPALNTIRTFAKETKQKAQFATVDAALTAYRNDFGDYPPSIGPGPSSQYYYGAQTLCVALLGYDLRGFHPLTNWNNIPEAYNPLIDPDTFAKRKDRYLEVSTTDAFKIKDLSPEGTGPLDPESFVLCDAFKNFNVNLSNGRTVKAGTPILYYRANTAGTTIENIYNFSDNVEIIKLMGLVLDGNPLMHPMNNTTVFQNAIADPKALVGSKLYPYRPDSYILISAGADGLYGTADDIHNFGN